MGDDQIKKVSIDKSPVLACKLGDIRFSSETTKPLGGINPHCKQFDIIGRQFKNILISHANYAPKLRILDVGCGTGRLAKQLLSKNYIGIDNNDYFLQYCRAEYKGMRFLHHDVRHEEYNPNGTVEPLDSSLPFDDKSLDLVVCFGLFNHFHYEWVLHYITEFSRVLTPRGILAFTIILLNDHSKELIREGKTKRPFQFDYKTELSWHEFKDRPLLNVAIDEVSVRRSLLHNKLIIKEPIRYGEWCLGNNPLSGHDIVIARKNGWGF